MKKKKLEKSVRKVGTLKVWIFIFSDSENTWNKPQNNKNVFWQI